MKVGAVVVFGFAWAAVQLAHAAGSVSAVQLAGITAAVEACTQLDQQVGAKVKTQAGGMLAGLSDKTLAGLRQGAGYNAAYSQYVSSFASLDKSQLAQLCTAAETNLPRQLTPLGPTVENRPRPNGH
ncbi:MAG: hypothetical protein E6H52_18485 [Betaproteobacteria bacterium]|nr:MAG: hypothetical protein E6H52_18485 [Betaproteobacteria bacterium]